MQIIEGKLCLGLVKDWRKSGSWEPRSSKYELTESEINKAMLQGVSEGSLRAVCKLTENFPWYSLRELYHIKMADVESRLTEKQCVIFIGR